MTAITFVGAGTGVGGDNASLTPALPTGCVAGDLILVSAFIRNTSATPVKPAGYGSFFVNSGAALFWKIHSGAESDPTVTYTGGSAGDTTLAQCAVFRTAWAHVQTVFDGASNTSAQNIALPSSATPGRDGALLLALGMKADDWTSVASLTGMTEIGDFSSTAGSDAGMVWDYQIQTTAAASPAGPFTVTGGASATSVSFIVALDQAASIAVTTQDVYPPRVQIAVTNLIVGDAIELYRVVNGQRTLVRAGSDSAITDTSFVRVDAELPFGVPVGYIAVINGADGPTVDATTYTLPGGKVVLSDAITGLAAEVVITAWPDKTRARRSSTFVAGGRNVAVLGDLAGFTSAVDVYVETTSAASNVTALLTNATSGTIQIRQPGGYDGIDSYVAVLDATEHRFSQDGSDERRTFSLNVVQNDGWAPALEARAFTYGDVEDAYDGLTYADAEGDFDTYLDAILADWS